MKPDPHPKIEIIKNSFAVDDKVFHALMALGVLKEIAIKAKGANHQRWSAFMERTGRFAESPVFPAWSKQDVLEYVALILAMSNPDYPLYPYAHEGVAALDEFSEQACREYEHLINVGASINRPPYSYIRI